MYSLVDVITNVFVVVVIIDVIKYCGCSRWYEKIPPGGDTSIWRWDLQSEVGPPFGGDTSNWRWDLQLEVGLWVQMEISAPIGGHFSFGLQRGRIYFYFLWYLLYVSHFLHYVGIVVYNQTSLCVYMAKIIKFYDEIWIFKFEYEWWEWKKLFICHLLNWTCT